MKRGRDVAIVGRPNVGKSALFNRLAGRRIAIVHNQPGITRDRISTEAEADGKKFRLWDTGGIVGAGEKELTDEVRASAERAMEESALVLLVVDAQEGLTPMDRELARFLRRQNKPVLVVVNKIDDPKHEPNAAEFAELGFENVFSISAAHGRNTGPLLSEIARLLPEELREKPMERPPPVKIAIVGRPNAGKSSLINALIRDHRSLVSEIPGTTRDSVDIECECDGKRYLLIDTAGIRARSKHSTSVEVFSVMRAEKSIERADVCVLVVDLTEGVKAQDRRIAALIQKARKPCIIVLNKWDLVRPKRKEREAMEQVVETARAELFFIAYAPILTMSARTGEQADRIFKAIGKMGKTAHIHIGTGKLNRLLHAAFASNPPPMVGNRRLKLFYATQASDDGRRPIPPPEFVLFANSPRLATDPFTRFLESKVREVEPYTGLPILLTFRARTETR